MSAEERVEYGAGLMGGMREYYEGLSQATNECKEAARQCEGAAKECRKVTSELRTVAPTLNGRQNDPQDPVPAPLPSASAVEITRHTQPRASIRLPRPTILAHLRGFMGDENASFTCPEQALALDLATKANASFFLIGPTGMGKSSVFLIPAKREPDKVTIVILPLSGLRFDFSMRCKGLGIDCTEWTTESQCRSTVVMVSPENAPRCEFTRWAKNLYLRGILRLIVYDEVHLIVTQAPFRDCFNTVNEIVGIGK